MNKLIAVTAGEPAGIGPDLCVLLAQRQVKTPAVVFADPQLLLNRARQLGLTIQLKAFSAPQSSASAAENYCGYGQLLYFPVQLKDPNVVCGILNAENVDYVLQGLSQAVEMCRQKIFSALVTGPIHKGIINQSGLAFTGHTEYLAQLTHTEKVVMMLATDGLRIALATTHLPLNRVAAAITRESLKQVIYIIDQDLKHHFGIANPHIFVCGLNPHAGEGGHLGREEIETITPVLQQLRAEGIRLTGPLSADTIFSAQNMQSADVFLAMYHDQGLPVLKFKGFGNAVNITLGLPFIRTSVDHGTALEKAGTADINPNSLFYAIETALNTGASAAQQSPS